MTQTFDKDVWCGDVLVVGAGAAGILIAERLVAAGFSVTIVEKHAWGASQSSHSHGYLHRGHIYASPSEALVRNLNQGANEWMRLLADESPQFETASVAFANAWAADTASEAWRRAGLEFAPMTPPSQLATGAKLSYFSTQEVTYDFTKWLRQTPGRLDGVTTIRGEVSELHRSGYSVDFVSLETSFGPVSARAGHYVLAAGTGNLDLVSTATNYRGYGLNRLSYMLLLRGKHLPALSLVIPENDAYGMFLVSRKDSGSTVWLVSNYLSFAFAQISSRAVQLWLRATWRNLVGILPALESQPFEWSLYSAPKGELRKLRGRLDIHSIQSYGLKNLTVASPSKLTLAPLLAEDVAIRVERQLPYARPTYGDPSQVIHQHLSVRPERWLHADWRPMSELFQLTSGGPADVTILERTSLEREDLLPCLQ